MAARKQFLLHHKALGAHVRTLFNQRLRKEYPELWAQVPPAVWKTPWNVGAQAAGSGQDALRYLSRYIFKTATSNRPVQLLPEGKLLWTYQLLVREGLGEDLARNPQRGPERSRTIVVSFSTQSRFMLQQHEY